MRYLLGANTLIDLCFEGTPSAVWAADVKTHELRISVISLAAARAVIESDAANPVERGQLKQAFETRLATLVSDDAQILVFGKREADEWQKWRSHAPLDSDIGGVLSPVGHDTRMVIATAFINGLELAEPTEAYHDELKALGLAVRSL